jgi:hypothetical protein
MGLWDQLLQMGSAYVKHVGIIKQLVEAAPEQRVSVMTNYVRGLSDQSFNGFKVLMLNAVSEEKGAQAQSVLQALLKNLDAVRAGRPVAADATSAAPATADATSPADNVVTPSMSAEEAFVADAHFCNEHWYNKPVEEKLTKLVDTLIKFDDARYQQFTGHLRQMRDNHMTHIQAHDADELNAWGTYFEDRMAYFAARERTGQKDPEWMKRKRELQSTLDDFDWLINACEQYWPIILKKKQAARAPNERSATG